MKNFYISFLRWFKEHSGFGLYALSLFILMTGAYFLLAGRMGFNYDDWEGIFLYQQGFSAQQVWNYFLVDRPFSSLVHLALHPLLGTSVEGWHLLTLVLHWAAILFLVKSLLALFPGHIIPIGWVGFLLALYPGLTRHFVARTSAPHYLSMFFFAASLWLMIQAYQQNKRRGWMLSLSVLLALAQVLIIEYFAAMEIARFFIILYLFSREYRGQRLQVFRKSLTAWLPYLAVFLVFLVFKFQILPGLAQDEGLDAKHQVGFVQSLIESPAPTILRYTNLVLRDVVYALLHVWLLPLDFTELDVSSTSYVASWLLGFFFAALAAITLWGWFQKDDAAERTFPAAWQVIGLSLVTLLLGGLPGWLIGRQATVGIWSSRFLLPVVLGAVPLVVLAVAWLAGKNRQQAANLALAMLLAGAFSYQFREANRYTLYWNYQHQYYWQLKWRAPGLAAKTFILTPNTPFIRNSHYQIAYGINLVYAPGNANPDSRHWWFDGPDTLRDYVSQQYKPGRPVTASMRNIQFTSEMALALPVLSRPSRGCVQVLTDTYYQGEPLLSFEENQLFELAKDNLVLADGPAMPLNVFGPEPKHGWCYYYQKAELARDFANWDEIRSLWQQAQAEKLETGFGPEYAPFIEMLARNQEWQAAVKLTHKAGKITKEARPFFCSFWQAQLSPLPGFAEWWPEIQTENGCE